MIFSSFDLIVQAAFLFTVVGTTGFLAVLAGQLPGVLLLPWHLLYVTFKYDGHNTKNLNFELPVCIFVAGLGLLCSLLDWEHFVDSVGCWKYCSRVCVRSRLCKFARAEIIMFKYIVFSII